MCMIKVRPEVEEHPVVPARVVRRSSTRSHRNRSRTSVRSRDRSRSRSRDDTIIKIPAPPPATTQTTETTTMIIQGDQHQNQHRHRDRDWGNAGSPRASVVSSRSNRDVDYYVDNSASNGRSPRASGIRYVDGNPRGSSQRITDGSGVGAERYGYNNFHGRRSGSVSYINPRQSSVSQRSARETREKVVVVDQYGNESYY